MGEEVPAWFERNCAMEAHEGTSVRDGRALHWLRWGEPTAPPLVLLHGGAAHARWWSPLAPFLADTWCVLAPDLAGMGDSDWRSDGYRTEDWAEDVLHVVVDACPARPTPPVLVGHSMGATVAAIAAAGRPADVRAVLLCDIGVPRAGHAAAQRSGRHFQNRITYPTAADALARFTLTPRQTCPNPWMVEHIARASLRPVGGHGPADPTRPPPGTEVAWAWKFDWRVFARTTEKPLREYLEDLGRTAVPVGCVYGEESRVAPPEVVERVGARLGLCPTVSIPDAGHHLMLDQPIAFVTAVRGLLAALLPDPPGGSAPGPEPSGWSAAATRRPSPPGRAVRPGR